MIRASDIQTGDVILFVGGTGRGDADTVTEGIVNGDPFEVLVLGDDEPTVYVPVHVRETNQNVVVVGSNVLTTPS